MSLEPGSSLGPYRVIERIGKGGMATVYKGYQPALDRHVALKVLPETLATDPDFRQRFEQEARAIARLRHPSILAVHDYGSEGGIAYIVTDLIEGGTLADRLGHPLPVGEVAEALAPIASALDYAHTRGVLHRDVKPSNILLTPDGTAVLSDFGLAKMLEAEGHLAKASAILGTPQYMAPEQCEGAPPTPAADVYSLAVVAYEMLTGRPPYVAETPAAIILAQIQGHLPPPRQLNPELSAAVEAVLLKGLARDPADRYSTCMALTQALAQAGRVEPAPAVAPGPARPGRRPARPALAAGLVAMALIVAVVAVVAGAGLLSRTAVSGRPSPSPVATPTPAASPIPQPPQRAEADLPDARQESAAVAVGGTLYVIGGLDAPGNSLDGVDAYSQGAWAPGPKLPLGLDHAGATVLGAQVYVAGGYSSGKASSRAFRLSGTTWAEIAPLHHARGAFALLAVGGMLYALGGESGGAQVAPTEAYDPARNAWADLPAIPQPRNHVAGFVYRNLACVAGGRPPETNRVDCYDPALKTWSTLPALALATGGAGAGSLGDEVVVAGGENTVQGVIVDQVARLGDSGWRSGPMLVPRHGIALALFGDRLWACGGGTAVGLHPVTSCTSLGPGSA